MSGEWTTFDWNGRKAKAWMPDALTERAFSFSEATVRAAEQATAALHQADDQLPTNWEPLARLLLRTEGIASSSIEGLRAPLVDVAVAELTEVANSADWIADNLRAVSSALASSGPLTIALLHSWHRQLMGHSPLEPSMIGAFRTAPSWIGGTSPLDASSVPPPASALPELMANFVAYANSEWHDPVTQAALLHAQFETIHPYGDGNGRLGRILIGWLLRRRGAIVKLPPPISVLIARDPGGYISGLHLFREGPVDPWVRWFADVTHASANRSTAMIGHITNTLDEWEQQLSQLRADSAARRIIPLLPQFPVLTATTIAQQLNVSDRAGRVALETLAEHQIVERVDIEHRGAGRPAAHFAATKLLTSTAGWD